MPYSYTVAIYLVVIGLAPLGWSPYATFCNSFLKSATLLELKYQLDGRQPVYLVSLPIFVAGSIGVAESKSLTALIITRIIQVSFFSVALREAYGSDRALVQAVCCRLALVLLATYIDQLNVDALWASISLYI